MYTRWGSSSCPNITGTELIYSGRAAGAWWSDQGGGANHLCLPNDPEYTLPHKEGAQSEGVVHGVEYVRPVREDITETVHHNVPCAVCEVTSREKVLMIPAKTSCPVSWSREYYGYLMSTSTVQRHSRTIYECVDRDQETIAGAEEFTSGSVFYNAEVSCDTGLLCPPYNSTLELNCVVCSK